MSLGFLKDPNTNKKLLVEDEEIYRKIAANIQEVFDVAMLVEYCDDEMILLASRQLFIAFNEKLKNYLLKNSDFASILVNGMSTVPMKSRRLYFRTLAICTLDSSNRINPEFANKQFFTQLFSHVDHELEMAVINLMLKNQNSQFVSLVIEFDVCTILAQCAATSDNARVILREFSLGSCGIELNRFVASALLKFPVGDDPEYLLFLHTLSKNYHRTTEWRMILEKIEPRMASYTEKALRIEKFTREKKTLVELVFSIVERQGSMGDGEIQLFCQLVEQFFIYKHNTFLHSTVDSIVKVLAEHRLLTRRIVEQSQIHRRIIDAYRSMDDGANYTAHLRSISERISRLTPRGLRYEWTSAVMSKNKEDQKIISASPKIDKIAILVSTSVALLAFGLFIKLFINH